MSEQETVSERELAEYFSNEVFSPGQPRSVGEALAAAEETPPEPEPAAEETPPVVVDGPVQPEVEETEEPLEVEAVQEPVEGEEPEEVEDGEEPVEAQSDDVAWAMKRYGEDPEKWAKGARDQDRHISKIQGENQELRELAQAWWNEAQQAQMAAEQTQQAQMPITAQEEAWVEQAMTQPLEYARAAAFNGNINLFNAVLERVAEENAMLAANIGSQVQMDLRNVADAQMYEQAQAQQGPPLDQALGASFQRLGLDLSVAGPTMMQKVEELGQYHPYVQAMLGADDGQRDLAIQAVHDLVTSGHMNRRTVRDEDKAARIRREGELRREAAGVVTGSPHVNAAPIDPLMAAMEQEWKDRGQWGEE